MLSQDVIAGTGGTAVPESQYVFIVYDGDSGAIHHIHQVVNLPGAEVRSREQMEQAALDYLAPQTRELTSLAVLSVPHHQLERGRFYRVDHEQQVLMTVERKR